MEIAVAKNIKVSRPTLRAYYWKLMQISYSFYNEKNEMTLLNDELELDETKIYKPKRSKARGRIYKSNSFWLFGIVERGKQNFFVR